MRFRITFIKHPNLTVINYTSWCRIGGVWRSTDRVICEVNVFLRHIPCRVYTGHKAELLRKVELLEFARDDVGTVSA